MLPFVNALKAAGISKIFNKESLGVNLDFIGGSFDFRK
jgi:hypothetical protein